MASPTQPPQETFSSDNLSKRLEQHLGKLYIVDVVLYIMANEAILVQQLEERFFEATIADGSSGTDIAKGTIMKWGSDPNTVVVSSSDGDLFAGILQS